MQKDIHELNLLLGKDNEILTNLMNEPFSILQEKSARNPAE